MWRESFPFHIYIYIYICVCVCVSLSLSLPSLLQAHTLIHTCGVMFIAIRKWTWWAAFRSWTRMLAFHFHANAPEKGMNPYIPPSVMGLVRQLGSSLGRAIIHGERYTKKKVTTKTSRLGWRIHQLHLCRRVRPHPTECPLHYLMVRLQF